MERPKILITVTNGVADYAVQGDADVEVVDFDVFEGAEDESDLPKMSDEFKAAFPEMAGILESERDTWLTDREEARTNA